MMLALAMAAMLQAAVAKADVVVTGRRARPAREVAQQVEAILPVQPSTEPFARFTDPVCPGVIGLEGHRAQAVADRIGAIAAGAGLRVGQPGCTPNLLLIVAQDGRETVRRALRGSAGALRGQSLADYRRILAEPGHARAWTEAEVRSRDGDRLQINDNGPPTLSVPAASRIVTAHRRDIVSAVVVIDAAAVVGRDTRQIADYAAMRALTGAIPGRRGQGQTILSAFGDREDDATPTELTATDRAILNGLYTGPGAVRSGAMLQDITRRIVDARE